METNNLGNNDKSYKIKKLIVDGKEIKDPENGFKLDLPKSTINIDIKVDTKDTGDQEVGKL
ncbi:MAG: hypothetical protein A2Y24_04480 [Clostridiales bacterium GWE2_32_10]|nr:MAG: hypothetical protein A2Y24_04480 [Clostridiales bacterium GWE2_32_10]HBY20917.1 hypothetical protein [Clostridiales bacterium]